MYSGIGQSNNGKYFCFFFLSWVGALKPLRRRDFFDIRNLSPADLSPHLPITCGVSYPSNIWCPVSSLHWQSKAGDKWQEQTPQLVLYVKQRAHRNREKGGGLWGFVELMLNPPEFTKDTWNQMIDSQPPRRSHVPFLTISTSKSFRRLSLPGNKFSLCFNGVWVPCVYVFTSRPILTQFMSFFSFSLSQTYP